MCFHSFCPVMIRNIDINDSAPNVTRIVSLCIFFVSLILLIISEVSFIYAGDDLACG